MTEASGGPGAPSSPRVVYQGEPGAYGEMAIVQEWRGTAKAVGAATFPDAIGLLARGSAEYAVIPVWNSTIGDIRDTRQLLAHHSERLETVSELTVPVEHCLLGLPGASLATIRYVGSHPTALAQCRRLFADRPALEPCVAYDTAGAARELSALGGRVAFAGTRAAAPPWFEPYRPIAPTALAVIAGAAAARLYGLIVLAKGVQDQPGNETRFVVLKSR